MANLARLSACTEWPDLRAVEHATLAEIDATDRGLLPAEYGRVLLLKLLPG